MLSSIFRPNSSRRKKEQWQLLESKCEREGADDDEQREKEDEE